jgi:hypothetical protein
LVCLFLLEHLQPCDTQLQKVRQCRRHEDQKKKRVWCELIICISSGHLRAPITW